jgi:murein DD-endopeptidase MepM/ murein hydrolase activator NlpD
MANDPYNTNFQPVRATPYSYGGCLSGFTLIPVTVILISTIVFFFLSRITVASSSTLEQVDVENDSSVFVPPYDNYTVTQGPHGFTYGHKAIDIAAGKGATIFSPINGKVTKLYVDEIGNPTLVIENKNFLVTMLHGIYTVQVGQSLSAGQAVGTESNLGNTMDMQGNSCRNRDCGYHTHLNVYDKRQLVNVNPLDLLEP